MSAAERALSADPQTVALVAQPRRLTRAFQGTSAELLERLLSVLLADASTALDLTWGRGRFWTGLGGVAVTGLDISPHGAPAVVGDFTRLPFGDSTFDVAIFDPPYLTEAGTGSLVRQRFGSYPSIPALHAAVEAGCREAWRVASIGVVVKVMDYVHAGRLVRMTRWAEDAIPADLYDYVHLTSRAKPEDPKWSRVGAEQLSVRSNATTWLVFRKDGPIHRRRSVGANSGPRGRRGGAVKNRQRKAQAELFSKEAAG